VRRKDGSRPLDLGPITRQPSDRTGAVRGLPSGVQPSTYRDSQGQENRDTSSLETSGRSEPPLRIHVAEIEVTIGSRDIDIPVDRRSGKSKVKTPAKSEPSV
jgi:hypothetical protein